jgi:pseudaminic acid synthase
MHDRKAETFLKTFDSASDVSIIAEISANHQGNINSAFKLIDIAKESGANAVKFQTYTADTLSLDSLEDDFLLPEKSPWHKFKNYYGLYSNSYTPWEWHKALFDYTISLGMIPFSSPFDESAVDFLESLNCTIYKLASPEINHIPLVQKIAKTMKPILISLGTASESDLDLAIFEFRKLSNAQIVIMQCESNYPAKETDANINQLRYLTQKHKTHVGYSDHTIGYKSAALAIALGAKVIEKHLAEGSNEEEIDGFFSASKETFPIYCTELRLTESILGKSVFRNDGMQVEMISKQRSIYPIYNIEKSEVVTASNIKVIRPGYSLHPKFFHSIIGKRAKRLIRKGERLKLEDFE